MKAVIINIVVIICFTALSIYFNQWWIVLFSALFMFKEEHKEWNGDFDEDKKNDS